MRSLVLVFVILISSSTVALANIPQESQFPKDGTGLLDYCGVIVNQLDFPSTQVDTGEVMKFGWCVGYLQATLERISSWRMAAGMEVMAYQKNGKAAPSHMWADQDFVSTCIPDNASIGQLARVVVKWLRERPEKLHEPKSFLVMEALKDAFPCPAQVQDTVKP